MSAAYQNGDKHYDVGPLCSIHYDVGPLCSIHFDVGPLCSMHFASVLLNIWSRNILKDRRFMMYVISLVLG